ncbi:S8 family serine peptidase [Streptomyces sp. 35G-GA-8]|uniref:S8 family serine peptidase n=1 Tax=Streptomyces sp. 35G-GA-8 TaxID=2939434 RepID=UPI00201F22F3|nr:S8 family serine peptidase [Streptomyces sp. 35G-GA-8]MCL7382338.1 S8 family serine peptidase [Streptomyces sp. 35G-GA-8]
MTAGMSQARKRGAPHVMRRGLLCAMAVVGACTLGVVGMAPAAIAADGVQAKQWYLNAMDAEEIWKSATGEGIKVAVIDTGVNPSTPSLKGQVLKGFDATGTDGEATDDYDGHGTTMAELIAGTGNGGGLRGLAPGAKIIPMRITDTELQNTKPVNAQDSEDAIRAAADSDAQIISMSLGSDFVSPEEKEAVEYAESKGKLFFAAVGNKAKEGNKKQYPASYRQVIGVAATDSEGQVADYSQHGDFVDIAAPGNDIPHWCDEKFKSYCDGNGGTSAATAIASASAALIWSANPEWTANQVLRVMLESAGRSEDAKPGSVSDYIGHGIVRPGAHINRGVGKPGDPNLNPLTNERTPGSPGAPGASESSASSAPSGSASESGDGASGAAEAGADGDKAVAAGASKSTEDDSQLGLILGGAAVVVVLAGGAFFFLRKRRTA